MKKQILENKKIGGVTLITLVITIIVLLILAGVTILALTGESGILKKSNTAKEETRKQTATEILNLKITNLQMQTYAKEQRMPILKELAISLDPENDNEIQSVTKTSQKTSSLDWIDTDYTSIFTILKDYPEYEFEINSNLQLASINGVKVGNSDEESKPDYDQLVALVTTLSQKVTELEKNRNPTGTIISYSANNEPEGYLKCEGQEVSRTQYSNLFQVIGTTYGNGDGNTTFNVPDLRGEFLRGTGTNASTQYAGAEVGVHQQPTTHVWMGIDYRLKGYARLYGGTTTDSKENVESHAVDSVEKSTDTNGWTLDANGNQYSTWGSSGVKSYTSRPTNTSVLYCIKY